MGEMSFDVHSRMVSKVGRFLFTDVFDDLEVLCASLEKVVLCSSSPSHSVRTSQLLPARNQTPDDFGLDSGAFHRRLLAQELEALDC